jgi:hypothetical protein
VTKLDDLRNSITPQQKSILGAIWNYYEKEKSWIPIRVLHSKFGSKESVRPQLDELGGSIVFENDDQGDRKYELTFLGILVSSYGELIEKQIATFLHIAIALAKKEPERTKINSKEIESIFKIDSSEIAFMGRVLYISPFHTDGRNGPDGWDCKLPDDIEDLPEDITSYIHQKVMRDYDKKVPIDPSARHSYLMSTLYIPKEERDTFIFMKNDALKSIVSSDWVEVQQCYQAKAWKYSIIGCASVLEGILLDCLLQDQEMAIEAQKKVNPSRNPGNDLLNWDLVDLVDAAKGMKIIGEASSLLGHALRLHRNLVHPGRQVKEIIKVSEEEAQISMNTVEKCIREFTERYKITK